MMKVLGFIAVFALLLVAIVVLVGQLGGLRGPAPTDMGVQQGRLKAPSATPNSVSSQADLHPGHPQQDYARIAPLRFQDGPDRAMQKLVAVLQAQERMILVQQTADYVYAQSQSAVLKFTDDVEFWLDRSAGVIHVRSASRLGRSDLGVNRARIETIRAQFEKN
jgi:uncharacterized protein (DUF1499 family)